MKSYNGTSAKTLTRLYTRHKPGSKAYLFSAMLDVSEDPVANTVVLMVYKNKGPIPQRNDGPSGGFPTAPQPLLLKGNGAGPRLAAQAIVLEEDDELWFTVTKFGGDPEAFPHWALEFRLCPLADDL